MITNEGPEVDQAEIDLTQLTKNQHLSHLIKNDRYIKVPVSTQ